MNEDISITHSEPNKRKIFIMSCIALLAIGFSFSLRTSIAGDLGSVFGKVDTLHSSTMVGSVLGVAFLGYAITIFIGSPLLDAIGMGLLIKLSSLFLTIGTLIVVLSEKLSGAAGIYGVIWSGMVVTGIGWGLVDTVTNPLLTTLYPDNKTHKLNVLHAWWPCGIMLGGILGLGIGYLGMSWKVKLCLTIIPAVIYGIMSFSAKFPLTERAAAGVSFGGMFMELVRRPMFFIWFFAMFLTAASELAPGQWVDLALTRTVGMKGIWLLIYVSGLMFIMRHFAGPLAHRLSPVGLLWVSCFLAGLGLWLLSVAKTPVIGFLAATVWGIGVCYMWPTMLATVSDRYPRGGALALGMMGTGGTLSIYFVLPIMGRIYDKAKIAAAGGEEAFKILSGEKLEEVLVVASQTSFRYVAILPAALLLVFGIVWLYDRAKGGYKPEKLTGGADK